MIVGPTKALFMDEISNGLDSSTTYQIICYLQQLSHITDATLLVSLLQPAPETFDLFDDIILMAEGKVVYHGARINVLEFFKSCGFCCPERKGVADFLQEVISRKDQEQYWHEAQRPYSYISVDMFSRKYKESLYAKELSAELAVPFDKSKGQKDALSFSTYSLPKWTLFRACMSREFLLLKRNSFVHIFRFLQLVIIASIAMTVFLRTEMGVDIFRANSYLGALYYSLIIFMFDVFSDLSMTTARLPNFYKQRELYFYPAWAFAVPFIIIRIPISLLVSVVWTSLTYYVIGFTPEPGRFFRQMILMFAAHMAFLSMYRFVASVFRSVMASKMVANLVNLFVLLFGGFNIPKSSMPIWLRWAFWISPLSYGMMALSGNEFHAPRWQKELSGGTTIGLQTLENRGFNFGEHLFWISVFALLGFAVLFNIGFTLALSFLKAPVYELMDTDLHQIIRSNQQLTDDHCRVSLVSKDSSMLDGLDNASIEMEEAKARLNQIITSGTKAVHKNPLPKKPWMVDGAGLPQNASDLLPQLANLTKKVTEQVRVSAKDEDEELVETSPYNVPYDQAKALGKTNIDVDRIAAGLPCGSEGFLLMFARWRKLERDLYSERKGRFDITQIPDIYDSCKYDLLHNAHLNLEGIHELFKVAQLLADGVIPNEYGVNPKQKLEIGSKIARCLLGKIMIDLRNTREEAISVAELKSNPDINSVVGPSNGSEDADYHSKSHSKIEGTRRASFTSEKSMEQDDDDDRETKYRLDPKYANVTTPDLHVRTRLYFTSESHIHSLMNVLRYCNLDESLEGEPSLLCDNALERLFRTKELDYMSYIVLRLFENTEVAIEDPKRFRVEMTFSRGADLSPLEGNDSEAASLHQEHTLPIMGPERLHEVGSYLTLEMMEKLIRPFAMPPEDFPPPSIPQGFTGYFSKSAAVLERLVNLWPFKHGNSNGKP